MPDIEYDGQSRHAGELQGRIIEVLSGRISITAELCNNAAHHRRADVIHVTPHSFYPLEAP